LAVVHKLTTSQQYFSIHVKTAVSLLVSLHPHLPCPTLLPDENLICCIIRITLKNNHLGELNKPPHFHLVDDISS
jgi:hypothetical protein